jgi:hypothetical protein
MDGKETRTTVLPTQPDPNVPQNHDKIQHPNHPRPSSKKKHSKSEIMKAIKRRRKYPDNKLNNSKQQKHTSKHEKRVDRRRKASKLRSRKRNSKRKKTTRGHSNNVRDPSIKVRKTSKSTGDILNKKRKLTGTLSTLKTPYMSRRTGDMLNKKRKVIGTLYKVKSSDLQVNFNLKNKRKNNSTFSTVKKSSSRNLSNPVGGTTSTETKSIGTTEIPQELSTFAVVRIPKRMSAATTRQKYETTNNRENRNNGGRPILDDKKDHVNLAFSVSNDSTKRGPRMTSRQSMFTAPDNVVTPNTPQAQTPLETLSPQATAPDNVVTPNTPQAQTPLETLSSQATSPNTTPGVLNEHHAKQSTLIKLVPDTEMYKTQPASLVFLNNRYTQKMTKAALKPKSSAKLTEDNTQFTFPAVSITIASHVLSKLSKNLQSGTGKTTSMFNQRNIETDITTDISFSVLSHTQTTAREQTVPVLRQSSETQRFYLQVRNTDLREYKGIRNTDIAQPIHKWIPDTNNQRTHEVNKSWSVKVNPPQDDWTASDNRASAVGIGSIGIIVIVAIISGVVCLDAATLYKDAKRIRKKIYRIFRPLDKRHCKHSSVSKAPPKWANFVMTREASDA